jgi:hypothetical protein
VQAVAGLMGEVVSDPEAGGEEHQFNHENDQHLFPHGSIVPVIRSRSHPSFGHWLISSRSLWKLQQQPLPNYYLDYLRSKIQKVVQSLPTEVQKTTVSDDR